MMSFSRAYVALVWDSKVSTIRNYLMRVIVIWRIMHNAGVNQLLR